MKTAKILQKYISFLKSNGHVQITNSPLVLQNDPTTLFTSSGMQALIPYLLGEVHPDGKRLVNAQNCIRTQDIEEVGDNRHTTFFRMIGNWGLGDYFKEEQIPWIWNFLTKDLELDPKRIFVTCCSGFPEFNIPKDTKSAEIWRNLFAQEGIDAKEIEIGSEANGSKVGEQGGQIFFYDKKNWWSREGAPDSMREGEPGGPDSEMFYLFPHVEHDSSYGEKCHPNCDCGRYIEIGNSVFMEYLRVQDGFEKLPKKNVDYGGGLERIAAAKNDDPDVYKTDLYSDIIKTIESVANTTYAENQTALRVIADHSKAAVFLIKDGVTPSNKEHGYILRRLIRRAAVKMHKLRGSLTPDAFDGIIAQVIRTEAALDSRLSIENDTKHIVSVVKEELERFIKSLEKGLKEVEKNLDRINDVAFDIFQTYGFPIEIIEELAKEKGITVDKTIFNEALNKHRELSRTASAGKFKGGLADHSERTIMGHTATHLMHQALRDVLGDHVHQSGSNITTERVRFDFNYDQRLTDEQINEVETIVNDKIADNLPVHFEIIPTEDAKKMGAIGLFEDTYGEKSKIYFMGGSSEDPTSAYSIEFCGGPHVDFTGKLKSFKIIKQENLGKGQKRLYAIVE